jgi:hypothetical protein
MSFSKLKPYNYVGMRSGETSMFGEKLSVREYFSFAARFLKDNRILKESIFEKPYLQNSRPQLHQDWSLPDWPNRPIDIGPGGDIDYRTHTFIFNEGMCSLSRMGDEECDGQIEISTWLGAAPLFTLSVRDISFTAVSSDENIAKVVSQDQDGLGNTTFIVELSETETGEASICVSGRLMSGKMLKELSYLIPSVIDGIKITPGWIPRLEYAMNNLMPVSETYTVPKWNCGCIDVDITCVCTGDLMTWDDVNSAETVAREASCVVYVTGDWDSSIEWSVSGSGFWFDEAYTLTTIETAGKSVTLYADADACGSATITACGATGYVRCTTGQWDTIDTCQSSTEGCSGAGPWTFHYYIGKYWYTVIICCANPCDDSCPSGPYGGGQCALYCGPPLDYYNQVYNYTQREWDCA